VRQIEAKAVEKLRQPGADIDLTSHLDVDLAERWQVTEELVVPV
jgi:hypothetical protein